MEAQPVTARIHHNRVDGDKAKDDKDLLTLKTFFKRSLSPSQMGLALAVHRCSSWATQVFDKRDFDQVWFFNDDQFVSQAIMLGVEKV